MSTPTDALAGVLSKRAPLTVQMFGVTTAYEVGTFRPVEVLRFVGPAVPCAVTVDAAAGVRFDHDAITVLPGMVPVVGVALRDRDGVPLVSWSARPQVRDTVAIRGTMGGEVDGL